MRPRAVTPAESISNSSHRRDLYGVGIEGTSAGKGLAKVDLTSMKLTTIGDFWFYTAVQPAYTVLTPKQSSTDGNLSTVKQDIGGFRIVGAGVSACAPTTPPR